MYALAGQCKQLHAKAISKTVNNGLKQFVKLGAGF